MGRPPRQSAQVGLAPPPPSSRPPPGLPCPPPSPSCLHPPRLPTAPPWLCPCPTHPLGTGTGTGTSTGTGTETLLGTIRDPPPLSPSPFIIPFTTPFTITPSTPPPAAGTNLMLVSSTSINLAQLGALSANGRSKTFDASAGGGGAVGRWGGGRLACSDGTAMALPPSLLLLLRLFLYALGKALGRGNARRASSRTLDRGQRQPSHALLSPQTLNPKPCHPCTRFPCLLTTLPPPNHLPTLPCHAMPLALALAVHTLPLPPHNTAPPQPPALPLALPPADGYGRGEGCIVWVLRLPAGERRGACAGQGTHVSAGEILSTCQLVRGGQGSQGRLRWAGQGRLSGQGRLRWAGHPRLCCVGSFPPAQCRARAHLTLLLCWGPSQLPSAMHACMRVAGTSGLRGGGAAQRGAFLGAPPLGAPPLPNCGPPPGHQPPPSQPTPPSPPPPRLCSLPLQPPPLPQQAASSHRCAWSTAPPTTRTGAAAGSQRQMAPPRCCCCRRRCGFLAGSGLPGQAGWLSPPPLQPPRPLAALPSTLMDLPVSPTLPAMLPTFVGFHPCGQGRQSCPSLPMPSRAPGSAARPAACWHRPRRSALNGLPCPCTLPCTPPCTLLCTPPCTLPCRQHWSAQRCRWQRQLHTKSGSSACTAQVCVCVCVCVRACLGDWQRRPPLPLPLP